MYVLGVRPITNGFNLWTIEPQPVDLSWAQGDVPTPKGAISVRWARSEGDASFVLTVESPRGTVGRVAIPLLGADRDIAMDGKLVWTQSKPAGRLPIHREGDSVVFANIAGSHTFAWRASARPPGSV